MLRFVAAISAALIPAAAQAHLLPEHHATMKVTDRSAFFVVSVPASALTGVDDNADGLLSHAEISRHQQVMSDQFLAHFDVRDEGNTARIGPAYITAPHTDGSEGDAAYVIVMHRVDFERAPQHPAVTFDLFGPMAGEEQLKLKASRGEETETVTFTPALPAHIFFRAH